MSDKTERVLCAPKAVIVREPLTTVLEKGRFLTDNRVGQIVESRYRFFTMRITAVQMIYLRTAKKQLPAVTQIIKERSDTVFVDIHAMADLKMELTNEVAQQLLLHSEFRPTYQEMVFYQTLLGGTGYRVPGVVREERLLEHEAVQSLLLKLLQEAYFTVKSGGRKGLYYWMKSKGAAGSPPIPEWGEGEWKDRYEVRRFQSEMLSHLNRQQEFLEKVEKKEQVFYSQELYFLKKETEVYKETALREAQEIQKNITFPTAQRMNELADTVYERLEKQMENEKKRRGM